MSTSSSPPETWIASFCSLLGHEYFAEVSEEFIEDDFNLTGLQSQVTLYKEALEMILDVEPEDDDEEEDEEEEDENETGEERPRGERRQHARIPSDLSMIEGSAELLYGLIHQRFICSRAGIQQMSEKYELSHFGVCPRTYCNLARTLPVGLSDIPGEDTVKLFCPSCLDVYVPPNSRFQTVDGAFFGRTFGALFLLTFPEYDLSRNGAEALTTLTQQPDGASSTGGSAVSAGGNGGGGGSGGNGGVGNGNGSGSGSGVNVGNNTSFILNGVYARNIAPGLGRGKIFEPKIYGFRVSEIARSGPRMQWLRSKPEDVTELDEVRQYAAQHPDSDDEVGAAGKKNNGGGADGSAPSNRRARTTRQQAAQSHRQRHAQNESPMSVGATMVESEL